MCLIKLAASYESLGYWTFLYYIMLLEFSLLLIWSVRNASCFAKANFVQRFLIWLMEIIIFSVEHTICVCVVLRIVSEKRPFTSNSNSPPLHLHRHSRNICLVPDIVSPTRHLSLHGQSQEIWFGGRLRCLFLFFVMSSSRRSFSVFSTILFGDGDFCTESPLERRWEFQINIILNLW